MSQWALMEFMCPVHGRFESTELRAEAPDEKPCPEIICIEGCEPGTPLDPDGDAPGFVKIERCGLASPWVIGAPMVRKLTIKVQAVSTAKSHDRDPRMLDTRKLGLDGQSMSDWNKERDREDRDARRKWVKKHFG